MNNEALNKVPFEVMESERLPDVSDVREERGVVPPAKAVLVRIESATTRKSLEQNKQPESEENPVLLKKIALGVRLVEGIEVPDGEGGIKVAYKNKPMFQDVVYWAHPEHKKSDYYLKRQHLVGLRYLLTALGIDLKAPPAISDEWLANLKGQELRVDITQRKVQARDEEGNWVDTGDLSNELRNWRAA